MSEHYLEVVYSCEANSGNQEVLHDAVKLLRPGMVNLLIEENHISQATCMERGKNGDDGKSFFG
jgi:hypothetical protein